MDASPPSPMRAWRLAPALLAALFALAVLPVAFLGRDAAVLGERATSEAIDERDAHLPVIRQFAAELPQPDLVGYRSATAPGYHVAMAIPARLGVGVHGLRLISSLAGLALVPVVGVVVMAILHARANRMFERHGFTTRWHGPLF